MNPSWPIDTCYFRRFVAGGCLVVWASMACFGQSQQTRNRGEEYYNLITSNTAAPGDIWLKAGGVAYIWDTIPIMGKDASGAKHNWISNFRAFPEVQAEAGLFDFAMVKIESRPISFGMKPGWFSGALKLTPPDNKQLRINGVALDLKYLYNCIDEHPTLGGYTGFMPEGFMLKGNNFEGRLIYEFDLLPIISQLPLRLILNAGVRVPLSENAGQYIVEKSKGMYTDTLRRFTQALGSAGIVLNGYGYDFFVDYSVEAFDNVLSPIIVSTTGQPFLMYFSENPMYLTFGGNVRYENGIVLSASIPLLLSYNQGSSMTHSDQTALTELSPDPRFAEEEKLGIRNAFDPWFAQWKFVASVSIPIRSTISSAEMMRNFLLMKNRKQPQHLDIDKGLLSPENGAVQPDTAADRQQRLDKIKKQREEIQKGQ